MYCGGIASVSTSGNSTTASNRTVTTLPRRHARRVVASSNILLTVYANPDAGTSPQPPPAPALGNPSAVTMTATATATAMTTIMSTMSYTTVCPTNPASLVVVEYCATFTVPKCNCASQTAPAIPLTTVVASCDTCGAQGESSVTLTLPAAVVAGATNTAAAANAGFVAGPTQAALSAAAAAKNNVTATVTFTTTSTSSPGTFVTAAASAAVISKELLALIVAGTGTLYFAMLL